MKFSYTLNLSPIIQYLVDRAEEYYAFAKVHRSYHNVEHMQNVVNALCELTPFPSQELILAAVWHDAVYFPGATADANEICSAAALKMEFKQFQQNSGTQFDIVQSAAAMIEQTAVRVHLGQVEQRGDLAILLDADLKSLADPYDKFIETQKKIVAEHGGTWEQGAALCGKFLSSFLTCGRDNIYHTEYARTRWETRARYNIQQLIEDTQK